MKLLEVTATYSRTIQLEQYHPVKSEISVKVQLSVDDDPQMAIEGARQMARNHVMDELARTNDKIAKQAKNVFLGLPVAVREQMEI